jgi:hypothetical protein
MKQLIIAAGLLIAATSASFAQVYMGPGYYSSHYGAYHQRGGPGPRVGPGTGMGVGSQR